MSSQTTDNNKRLDYLDVAKGIGILLVILGHCQLGRIGRAHSLIYSFHMPLFFFLSGFVYKDYEIKIFLKKKIRGLLLPVIVFSCIYTLYKIFWPTFGLLLAYSNIIKSEKTDGRYS